VGEGTYPVVRPLTRWIHLGEQGSLGLTHDGENDRTEVEMRDIGPGCEGVEVALGAWIRALRSGEIELLQNILTDDFRLTCDPSIAGGRMNKAEFIEFVRHIRECTVEILSFTARRYNDTAIAQIFARVSERFEGDPVGAKAAELNRIVGGRVLAYASAWRPCENGEWRCFQHHLIGPVD
jgi:hypothetical protein